MRTYGIEVDVCVCLERTDLNESITNSLRETIVKRIVFEFLWWLFPFSLSTNKLHNNFKGSLSEDKITLWRHMLFVKHWLTLKRLRCGVERRQKNCPVQENRSPGQVED